MEWKFVKHKCLSVAEGMQIACLKDQHWQYGIKSQILWMNDNLEDNDIHLICKNTDGRDSILQAYITLTNLCVEIDGQYLECVGVGCVCVDKTCQHTGLGRLLIEKANSFIKEQKKYGILLCKDALVSFYEKCGWKRIQYESATVADNRYDHNIMLLGKACICSKIKIGKNF